jgi:hypothetical protein
MPPVTPTAPAPPDASTPRPEHATKPLLRLLHKAALLQQAHPEVAFVPVLVCRRRSYYTWRMGEELGFFPIEVYAQFVLQRAMVEIDHFNEVRDELGYTDLKLSETSEPGSSRR